MADELVRFLASLLRLLAIHIVEGLGYVTARILFPVLSLGWVRVDNAPEDTVTYNWLGFRRGSDGTVLFHPGTAGVLGIFFWFIALVLVLAVVR